MKKIVKLLFWGGGGEWGKPKEKVVKQLSAV